MPFPIDEKYILEAEQQLNLSFPPIFKSKMLKENGGEIEVEDDVWTIHPFFDKSDIKRIKRSSNHIILETRSSREWGQFPHNAIAIGDNGTGDKLILLTSNSSKNQLEETIYLWLHETGETIQIAEDINQLL